MIYYTIASNVRTGSSTLCDQLRANEIGYPLEQYTRKYRDQPIKDAGGYTGMKVMPGHMKIAVDHMEKSTKWIFLYREDKLQQAVSWLIARQNGQFSYKEDHPKYPLYFDFKKLSNIVKRFENAEARWFAYFEEHNIEPYKISYEKLMSNRGVEFNKILEYLGADTVEDIDKGTERVKQDCREKELWPIWYQECLDGKRRIIKSRINYKRIKTHYD